MAHPAAAGLLGEALAALVPASSGDEHGAADDTMSAMMASFPIGRLPNFPDVPLTHERLASLLESIGDPADVPG